MSQATLDKKKVTHDLLEGIIALFAEMGNPTNKPDKAKLEKFFAPNIEILSNDRTICRSTQELLDRTKDLQKRYSSITYSKLLEEPIFSDNRAVIRYNANLTDMKGEKKVFNLLCVLTIKDNKVTRWVDVVHEKGTKDFAS